VEAVKEVLVEDELKAEVLDELADVEGGGPYPRSDEDDVDVVEGENE